MASDFHQPLSAFICVQLMFLLGQGDELFVAWAVKQERVAEDLRDNGTSFAGKLRSNRLAISQAAFLDPHLNEFVCFESLVGGFDNFFIQVVLADHDEGLETMTLAAQKTFLFPGQL